MVDYEKTDPISKFSKEEFKKILEKETEGAIEDKTVDEYWEKYHEKEYAIQLIINKANALKRDMSKTNNHRTVVLLGSKDHTFSDKETKKAKKPFQSHITAWDFNDNKFIPLAILGSPKLASRKVEWGKKCKISTDIEKSVSKGITYTNEHLQRVDEFIDDGFKLDDLLKTLYALPEHITKDVADKYPYAVLYGEINKIGFISTYDETTEEFIKESPYFKTLDNTGSYIPCFKFTLRSPKELGIQNEHKTIWINLKTQYYGRTLFNVDGWNEKSARNIAQLDVPDDQVDVGKMEEELNDMLGGGAVKAFIIGKFGKWTVSKDVAYVNFNATAVFQTKFLPDKAITKEDSLSRILGKKIEKDTKADIERLKVQIKRNIEINDIDVAFEVLKEMGTFDGFDFNDNVCQRIVEKVRSNMKEEKSGTKKSDDDKKEEKKESKSDDKKEKEKKDEDSEKKEKKESKSDEKKEEKSEKKEKKNDSDSEEKSEKKEKKESKSDEKKEKKEEKSLLDELEEEKEKEKKNKDSEKEKEKKSESKSETLSESEIKNVKEAEDSVMDSVLDFTMEECIGMLKREIRKTLHDNSEKFAIWKKTRLDDVTKRYEEYKAKKESKKDEKKESKSDEKKESKSDEKKESKKQKKDEEEKNDEDDEPEVDEELKEQLQKVLKENNMSKESKAIALYILKKDSDNTGISRKVIIEKFRPDHKLEEINESLESLLKAKIINEPQKGCYSIGSID